MRVFTATASLLLMGLCWTIGTTQAQDADYPTFRPLPPVGNTAGQGYRLIGYIDPVRDDAQIANSFGSSFQTQTQNTQPMPVPPPAQGAPARMPFDESLHVWDDCNACGTCCTSCCGSKWFASAGGLIMGRNRPNGYWTTFETNNNVNQLMNTQHAGANWGGGGEVTVGYNFCPCGPALAFTYWSVGGLTGFASVRDPNDNLSTPIDLNTQFGPVLIGARPASDFFDNSREHRINRDEHVNNLEVNLLQSNLVNQGRFQMVALAGFRYFRFNDHVSFGATAAGHDFGELGGADEAYMDFHTTNNLFGGQVGAIFNYAATDRLGIFFTPKVALCGNQMITRSQLYSADGAQGFDIPAYKNDFSFLGELDFGMNYAVTQRFRLYLGYRIVAVTDLALADNQFLPFLADSAGFAQVKQNGDLVLHGAMFGGSWMF